MRSSAQSGSSGLVRVFERIYFGQLEGSSGTFGTKNSYPGRLSRQRKEQSGAESGVRGHPRAKTPVFAPGVKPWNNWDAAGSREKWEGPLGKWEIGKSILGKWEAGKLEKGG